MLNEFIKGIALVEGLEVFTSRSEEDFDYEGYVRIFNSEDVKELVVSTEKNYIYAKRYDRNIIILIIDKIAPLSILLSKARVEARRINNLYMNGDLQLTKLLKYKAELGRAKAASAAKPSLIDSIALGIFQDMAKKAKEPEAISKEDKVELHELAKEISKFKQAWMEKKKKAEE